MTEPSMLERCARAILRENIALSGADLRGLSAEQVVDVSWDTVLPIARAVLDELSTPDEAMIGEGYSTIYGITRSDIEPALVSSQAAKAFARMISQAKKGAE